MVNVNKLIATAIKKDASDLHLISGLKPMLRIARDLVEIEEEKELTQDNMYDIYDYFVRGSVAKDEIYKETKRLDTSFEYEDVRLRINISSCADTPIFTARIIKNELPTYKDLRSAGYCKKNDIPTTRTNVSNR